MGNLRSISKFTSDDIILNFFDELKAECTQKNVKLALVESSRGVPHPNGNFLVEGYFVTWPDPELCVAISGNFQKSFQILLHESCHLDQWLDKSVLWKALDHKGYNSTEIIHLWLLRLVELNKHQKSKYFDSVLEIEYDCEIRVVDKIINLDLSIPVEEYIQKANGYLYSLAFENKYRACLAKDPYLVKDIWSNMPKTFKHCGSAYKRIPKKVLQIFNQYSSINLV